MNGSGQTHQGLRITTKLFSNENLSSYNTCQDKVWYHSHCYCVILINAAELSKTARSDSPSQGEADELVPAGL